MCKALSWSQHTWVCPTQHRELLVGKIWNLNRQEQEGAQKEMSHPNSQSRAGAELGAEPGPAAHQPGQIWWRTLIFNFPVKISSLLPLRSSQYSHSRGVISTCCFFSPVKWDFVPFISSKLCSTHPSVYSQGCLQHKEKSGMSSKSLHEAWRDGKMCSSGVGVTAIRTPGAALFIYL